MSPGSSPTTNGCARSSSPAVSRHEQPHPPTPLCPHTIAGTAVPAPLGGHNQLAPARPRGPPPSKPPNTQETSVRTRFVSRSRASRLRKVARHHDLYGRALTRAVSFCSSPPCSLRRQTRRRAHSWFRQWGGRFCGPSGATDALTPAAGTAPTRLVPALAGCLPPTQSPATRARACVQQTGRGQSVARQQPWRLAPSVLHGQGGGLLGSGCVQRGVLPVVTCPYMTQGAG
jgi:hypothetical protein